MKNFSRAMAALVRLSFLELWRRNDVFALAILALALMVPLVLASPFGASGASRYLDEMALLLIWGYSLFIALGTSSRLFPPEFDNRTIYPLLSKPISRGRLLIGKYLGATAASVSALLFFYLLFAATILARGYGLSLAFFQGLYLHILFVLLTAAFGLLGSFLLSPAANRSLVSIILVGMFFFGRNLPTYADTVGSLLSGIVRFFYVVAPHAEFFDLRQRLIHGWGAVDGLTLLAVTGYAVAYIAIILVLSLWAFRRKRL